MEFGADDLHVGVVPREQAAQKVEVAFVELLLRSNVRIQAVEHRRQTEIACDLCGDIPESGRVPVLRSPRHAPTLQRILRKHHKVGRAVAGEAAFEGSDLSTKYFGG